MRSEPVIECAQCGSAMVSGVKVLGTREHAELHARRMIKSGCNHSRGKKSHRVMNRDPEGSSEDQYGRQDDRPYSGWNSAITIAVIVIVLGIVVLVYQLKY